MPRDVTQGKPTTRRYSEEEKAAAVRMVRTLRAELGTEHGTVQEGSFSVTAAHDAPLLWHERFASARQRISDWVARTGCRRDSHRGR